MLQSLQNLILNEWSVIFLEIATLIVLAQLLDAYIRFLAFSDKISVDIRPKLFAYSAIWGSASIVLYHLIFIEYGIHATTYKAILMLGWLPYFCICKHFIPFGLNQHVFVLGMGVICSLSQHTLSAIVIVSYLSGQSDKEIILLDAAGYLLLFVIFLPIFGQYFRNMLPSREFFDLRPQGIYIALLPHIIIAAPLMQIADNVLVHSWAERLSRIYLPLLFFFFYRYILRAAENFYDLQRLKRNKKRLEAQISALKEYNLLTQESQQQVSIMRHDLRHSYNLIYAMLESGNVSKAREHIITQEFLLEATYLPVFCQSPPINAALAINFRRAEDLGVNVMQKINLPSKMETNELDFALLLSNLLERAISDSFKCESRELSIIIQHVDEQFFLEISIRGDAHAALNENLLAFVKKYSAYADFSHTDGNTSLLMYWRDGGH